jgi:hypothetical protein
LILRLAQGDAWGFTTTARTAILAALLIALVAACAKGPDKAAKTIKGRKAAAHATASSAEATTTRPGSVATTRPASTPRPGSSSSIPAGTKAQSRASRSTTGPTTQAVAPFVEVWTGRQALVAQVVAVRGTAVFVLTCPPPGETQPCVATGYFADEQTKDLPPYESRPAFVLYEHGQPVGCTAQTLANFQCQGWLHQRVYGVTGVVRQQAANQGGDFILDVSTKQAA